MQHDYQGSTHLYEVEEVKNRVDSTLSEKAIVILDEVNFLWGYDALYHITRHTKANHILLTQKVYWYNDVSYEGVRSSLQPDYVVFTENSNDEGLNKYDPDSLGVLSAMLVRDYGSDARISIKALEIIGRLNKWDDDSVRTALKQAYTQIYMMNSSFGKS